MADEESAAPNWIELIDIRHITTPAAMPPEDEGASGRGISAALPSIPVSIAFISTPVRQILRAL
jgi:hypothetical protein